MQLTLRALSLTLLTVIAAGAIGLQTAFAGEQEYKPKMNATPLLQTKLAGLDGKEVIIKRFDIPPGFVRAKHYHPGAVFVYVLEGELTIETEGKGRQTFKAGELYEEPIRHAMRGRNLSTTNNLIFQVGDAGKPMMIKAEDKRVIRCAREGPSCAGLFLSSMQTAALFSTPRRHFYR